MTKSMAKSNDYHTLMNPFNGCDLMLGLEQHNEKLTKRLPVWGVGVKVFENKSHYRFTIEGKAGMMVCKETRTVAHIFTSLFERRQGLAKGLFAVAHATLGGIQHR